MTSLANPEVHNVRFYKPIPKAVYCMAMQPHENKLALSRSDASVEIWSLTHAPFIERTIASSTENFSIESLAWCGCRLFCVGLHGLLIEYDLYKLEVKSRAVVTGEAAFCLDINKQNSRIAVGTEQGYLNIFQIQIHEEEVLFEKFLDKQEGRILCLKSDHSGQFMVSGRLDTISILYSTRLGIRLSKLTCEASPKLMPIEVVDEIGETPCISAIFTSDNQLILAPNSGALQFINFDNDGAVVTQNIDTKKECEDPITLLAASGSAEFLVAADVGGNIAVWSLQDGLYVYHCKLPKYRLCPTAIAIDPVCNELVVAYSNGSLIE